MWSFKNCKYNLYRHLLTFLHENPRAIYSIVEDEHTKGLPVFGDVKLTQNTFCDRFQVVAVPTIYKKGK